MPIALTDRPEMGLIVFRLLFWLCALTILYGEIQLGIWLYQRLSATGALHYLHILLREFLRY